MKHFQNFDELTESFLNEDVAIGTAIRIGVDVWTLTAQTNTPIGDVFAGKKPMVVYTTEGVDSQLVFFWTNKGGSIVPSGVLVTEKETTSNGGLHEQEVVTEMNGEKITIRPDQLIGDLVNIKFTSLSSPRELKAKVDTGATISSLHADNYKINGNTVTFTCQPLGPNSVTVPLKTQHAVKSPDGGTQYRPVIELNIKINGKLMNGVLFNLNDRGNMDQPVLVGQNILQAGKFFVDPSRNESKETDWETLEKLVEGIKPISSGNDPIQELYQLMLTRNIKFRDLIHFIRGEVTKTDIEY